MARGLSIEGFSNSDDSVSVAVRVSPPTLRVSPELAEALLSSRPTLAKHACKHRGMGRFGDKIVDSTLPHLVEHLAIDLLVEENAEVIAGTTTWIDHAQGVMQVKVSSTAQGARETYAAITRAVALVNSYLEQ